MEWFGAATGFNNFFMVLGTGNYRFRWLSTIGPKVEWLHGYITSLKSTIALAIAIAIDTNNMANEF